MAVSDREEIESYTLGEFAGLVDLYGFSDPLIDKGKAYTSFSWRYGDVAVKLSFDWRDRIVSALPVKSNSHHEQKRSTKRSAIFCHTFLFF